MNNKHLASIMDRIFFIIRLTLLLALFGLTYYYYELGKVGDPRFFAFLQTRPGAVVSELFGWDVLPLKRVTKTEGEMSPAELKVKRMLEDKVRKSTVNARLTLNDGRVYEGYILSDAEGEVVFEERYGRSGGVQFTIPRRQIKSLERDISAVPEISYRDVLFQMEFPELQLFRRPPYTIVTELEFFDVEKTMRDLNQLVAEVEREFKPVIGITNQMDSVQLLYFKTEDEFARYRDKHAGHLDYSSAYYSPSEDRFVMYQHASSLAVQHAKARIDEAGQSYQRKYRNAKNKIEHWEDVEKNRIDSLARNETTRTLRHEGAHQLFYSLGIHSHIRAENIWLIEGLAVYCEEQPLGRRSSHSANLVRDMVARNKLPQFSDLINHRSMMGWGALGESISLELAYAQSWVAVHFFMQPQYREAFFRYLIAVRESATDPKFMKRPRFEVLAEVLGLSTHELELRLINYAGSI